MSAASTIARGNANSGGAKTCTDLPETCTVSSLQTALTNLIRAKNPNKTWAFVADLFGLKERAAKHRLANARAYTIEELQVLLQGEDGLSYLEILMADAEPVWWTWTKWVAQQAHLERVAADALQQRMQLESQMPMSTPRLKDSRNVKNMRSNFSKAKAALGILHPDSNSPVDRAVAQAKGARR
jgi:hypothetical protein